MLHNGGFWSYFYQGAGFARKSIHEQIVFATRDIETVGVTFIGHKPTFAHCHIRDISAKSFSHRRCKLATPHAMCSKRSPITQQLATQPIEDGTARHLRAIIDIIGISQNEIRFIRETGSHQSEPRDICWLTIGLGQNHPRCSGSPYAKRDGQFSPVEVTGRGWNKGVSQIGMLRRKMIDQRTGLVG